MEVILLEGLSYYINLIILIVGALFFCLILYKPNDSMTKLIGINS